MSDAFYRTFEEKHRGSRALIKSRLKAYLPFVSPLVELGKGVKTIDLGCGRGEWLELMTDIGFKPYGVDLDEDMLSGCLELGLHAEQGDAIALLAALPSESHAVISAFHVVEHISFEQLRTVVSEALRVLQPGGLLIMETPNPENIVVATKNFYLDPTHQRPIPPELLSFIPEYYGFARIKTIRLQESKDLVKSMSLTLQDVLGGVSPDYAVIAQKSAVEDIFHKLDSAFAHEYGLSLETLAARYGTQLQSQFQQTETYIADLLNSTSWRITAPLRWAMATSRQALDHLQAVLIRVKVLIRTFLAHAILYVRLRPSLSKVALIMINRLPVLKQRLKHIAISNAKLQNTPVIPAHMAHLTPRARRIYADLKTVNKNNKGKV